MDDGVTTHVSDAIEFAIMMQLHGDKFIGKKTINLIWKQDAKKE